MYMVRMVDKFGYQGRYTRSDGLHITLGGQPLPATVIREGIKNAGCILSGPVDKSWWVDLGF